MILISLGSSLAFAGRGSLEIMASAAAALGRLGQITAVSRFYRSPAWPDPSDPPFINACVSMTSPLSPPALMAALSAVETGFGRRRTRRFGPRTLDLDLIDYNGRVARFSEPPLELPHPRVAERLFMLVPIADIAPGWRHPQSGDDVSALIARLPRADAPTKLGP